MMTMERELTLQDSTSPPCKVAEMSCQHRLDHFHLQAANIGYFPQYPSLGVVRWDFVHILILPPEAASSIITILSVRAFPFSKSSGTAWWRRAMATEMHGSHMLAAFVIRQSLHSVEAPKSDCFLFCHGFSDVYL